MEQKKLKINVKDHSKSDGHVEYNLTILLPEGISFKIGKRYSELKNLNDSLKRETNNNAFPKFPPKKFFGFNSEEFINKRQQELNVYFEGICNCKEFSKLPSFVKFVDDCKKNIKDTRVKNVEQKVEKKNTNILKKRMSDKTFINKFREKLRPERNESKRLTQDDIKNMENEFESIVNDANKKYIPIDFDVELKQNEYTESEYEKLITSGSNLSEKDIKEDIEPGNDDNFNFVSDTNENVDGIEKEISQKMQDVINKRKEIEKIYDINEILKIL